MTPNAAREVIYAAFVSDWDVGPLSEYTFDNEIYTPPPDAPWVRVTVRHMISGQETLGGTGTRKFTRTGKVFIQIFTLQDSGTQLADVFVEKAKSIFEGRVFPGPLWFKDANVMENGADGAWYGITVSIDFQYEDVL
jgi:hypothetical protein